MPQLLCFLFLLFSWLQVHATTDNAPHPSPDGLFAIDNLGDTANGDHCFEIRTKAGAVVYSSQNSAELKLPTHASAIRWTPDSKFVLLWVQQGKYDSTCVFSTDDQKLIHLALGEVDSYTVPVRWVGPRTFVVEVSGPHGHNARMDMWHYRKTYRVATHPFKLKCVATSRTIHNGKVFFPDGPLL